MAATPTYQAITIIALLVAAAILIFMGISRESNKNKWAILDKAQQALQGPISTLKLGHPGVTTSAALTVQGQDGKDLYSMFAQANPARPNAPYFTITGPVLTTGPTGRADLPLPLK